MPTNTRTRGSLALLLSALASTGALVLPDSMANAQAFVNSGNPPPDCTSVFPELSVPEVGNKRVWPGYLANWDSGEICIPFTPTEDLIPPDYKGSDYYVEEFTDGRLREKWLECQKDPECAKKYMDLAGKFIRPDSRDTGTVDSFGAVAAEGDVDLADIRRPAYFGTGDFDEPIAAAETDTYIVEFTAPPDGYERTQLGLSEPIKLRGWYMQGEGVDDGSGQKIRSLIVFNHGGGSEITALGHIWYELDATTGDYVPREHGKPEEQTSAVAWRSFAHDFHAAGFDVLFVDRRGSGVSGGTTGYSNIEQANDIFRMLEQLETGNGLRVVSPAGEALDGPDGARAATGGISPRDLQIVVMGYSRGSYTAQWFMHKNFVENCDYDTGAAVCGPAVGLQNVRGVILIGANPGGIGHRRPGGHDLREAVFREAYNSSLLLDGSVLANIAKWPGLQIVKGTFDYVESLEGSLDAYRRAAGLKDISVFAGQHGLTRHTPPILAFMSQRMLAFATAAVLGHDSVEGSHEPADLRDLVLSSPQLWEMRLSRESWERR